MFAKYDLYFVLMIIMCLVLGFFWNKGCYADQIIINNPYTGKIETYTSTDMSGQSTYFDNETGDIEIVDRGSRTVLGSDGNMDQYESNDRNWYFPGNGRTGVRDDWSAFRMDTGE